MCEGEEEGVASPVKGGAWARLHASAAGRMWSLRFPGMAQDPSKRSLGDPDAARERGLTSVGGRCCVTTQGERQRDGRQFGMRVQMFGERFGQAVAPVACADEESRLRLANSLLRRKHPC